MKKIYGVCFIVVLTVFSSCAGGSATPKRSDTTVVNSGGPDSVANNAIIPAPAAPENANNSSLADTMYKVKDSSKKK